MNSITIALNGVMTSEFNKHTFSIMFEPKPFILLIDDDEDDLDMLSLAMTSYKIRIKTMNSGDKAMTWLNHFTIPSELPLLVILDYNMPRVNGEEVLLLIKKNPMLLQIPVVMFSTSVSPKFKQAIIQLGAFDCIAKPSDYSSYFAQMLSFKELAFSLMRSQIKANLTLQSN